MKAKTMGRNIARPLSDVIYRELPQKRPPKTRKPRPVRAAPSEFLERRPVGTSPLPYSQPVLATRRGDKKMPAQGGLEMLADEIELAIDTRNWRRLQGLLDSMREQGFRLDEPELAAFFAVRWLVFNAPMDVLDAADGDRELRLRLALGLLERGCDPKAADAHGNTVSARIRDLAGEEFLASVMTEYPSLKTVFCETRRSKN